MRVTRGLVLLVLLAGCGDQSFEAFLFDLSSEDARPLNKRERGILHGVANCMSIDTPSSEPVIEYCEGGPGDENCVDTVTNPRAVGTYRTQFDLISIKPDWKGVDAALAHEMIHRHLWKETGDPDVCHAGGFFRSCAPESFIGPNHGPSCG